MVQGPQSIVCANCGSPNSVGASFCLRCGASLSPGMGKFPPGSVGEAIGGNLSPGMGSLYPPGSAGQAGRVYPVALKARSTALILEIVIAFAGLLGIGWIYAGETNKGVLFLVGYLVWNVFALILDVVTLGIFVCLHLPINIALIIISAMSLNTYTKQHPEMFGA